ncbi:hypothetical protein CRE_10678 [Caenorhabditis remanei]|uniref:Bestrophin homolog n=2 Tax=Caenorhabditis remanei TaxID=31234 RepID=E3NIL4_CAERE|nr:hypothetical protein CRE_10678 [Caenorhabditis remanei]
MTWLFSRISWQLNSVLRDCNGSKWKYPNYQKTVSKSSKLQKSFLSLRSVQDRLSSRWYGSIWKSVRWELTMWVLAFAVVQCFYRYLMAENQQRFFEYAAIHLNVRLVHIPLTFMLGFLVTIVVDRWRSVFTNIGFIENDQSGYRVSEVEIWSQLRDRTQPIVMQLEAKNLSTKLVSSNSNVYIEVHRVDEDQKRMLYRSEVAKQTKLTWRPFTVQSDDLYGTDGMENDADSVQSMNTALMNIRQSMEMLTKCDWVPIPIAYRQVAFLAVRVYFIICLISRQYLLSAPPTEAQSIVPIMTILQFVFFVGWMKVAEALLNPLGEDDDDFECNWLIDRNMSTGIEIVDTCHDSCPPLKLEEPDDEKGTMYWCHPTKNGSQAPPTAVAISQHKNPFTKVLNMVHPTTPESSPPSYRLDVPKQ